MTDYYRYANPRFFSFYKRAMFIPPVKTMENAFFPFRKNILGQGQTFDGPFGQKEIIYADWTASGRAYRPIEDRIQKDILPFVANTHTEATITGTLMQKAYEEAKTVIKQHVNSCNDDMLIFCGSGMTAAVNKLQRILGLKIPERMMDYVKEDSCGDGKLAKNITGRMPLDEHLRPVVFVTEMEHHSNHISWLETIATVEIIACGADGNVDLNCFKKLLQQYRYRKYKIAAVTACSNVTGIETPYHTIAKMVHEFGGLCFVDFACSAPYVAMNMHPVENGAHLDAIYFSPHKFLGGPGTPGVLIFNKNIYHNLVPDQPGGGTVVYTNPWKVNEYVNNIEQREDGGTPPFLQGIKAAMCIRLKEAMGIENIQLRKQELLTAAFNRFSAIKGVEVLEGNVTKRLGVIAFVVHGAHYNLITKILNDRFGIQTRGGCSCAGTYGHKLLKVDKKSSYKILHAIRQGNVLCKPGWVRLSIHPTMTDCEIDFIMDAIELTACNFKEWMKDYACIPATNEYCFKGFKPKEQEQVKDWFNMQERL